MLSGFDLNVCEIILRSASKSYLKMVENSDLDSPDGFTKLMDRVEATFIKHFANSNRKKGMNILRPKVKIERHMVTFSLGKISSILIIINMPMVQSKLVSDCITFESLNLLVLSFPKSLDCKYFRFLVWLGGGSLSYPFSGYTCTRPPKSPESGSIHENYAAPL